MAMSKQRKNITLDPQVAEAIDAANENFSDLVNQWAHAYFVDNTQLVVERTMLKNLIERNEELEERLKQQISTEAEAEREELEQALSRVEDKFEGQAMETAYNDVSDDELYAEAADLNGTPAEPDNPAICNKARNLGITPGEFVTMLDDHELLSNGHVDPEVEG